MLNADYQSYGAAPCIFFQLGTPQAAMFKVGSFKAHPEIPDHLSPDALDFGLSCFKPDPAERNTAAQLLEHNFLAGPRRRRRGGKSPNPTPYRRFHSSGEFFAWDYSSESKVTELAQKNDTHTHTHRFVP